MEEIHAVHTPTCVRSTKGGQLYRTPSNQLHLLSYIIYSLIATVISAEFAHPSGLAMSGGSHSRGCQYSPPKASVTRQKKQKSRWRDKRRANKRVARIIGRQSWGSVRGQVVAALFRPTYPIYFSSLHIVFLFARRRGNTFARLFESIERREGKHGESARDRGNLRARELLGRDDRELRLFRKDRYGNGDVVRSLLRSALSLLSFPPSFRLRRPPLLMANVRNL